MEQLLQQLITITAGGGAQAVTALLFIVIIGVITTLVGLVVWSGFAPKWLGRLAGDIRLEREHSSFYFPVVTCIVLSIILSLLLSIFSIFRR